MARLGNVLFSKLRLDKKFLSICRRKSTGQKLDVLFWFSAPYPYWTERLEALQRRGNIRFEVVYTMQHDNDRSWNVEDLTFCNWYARSFQFRGKVIGIAPLRRLVSKRPRIVFAFHGIPEVGTSFAAHLLPRTQLVYYVEKTFDLVERRTRLKEIAKFLLFRSASGFATPGSDADEYVVKYAGTNARIARTDHVVNVEHFRRARLLRTSDEIRQRRKDLGLYGTVFLNVGRQWDQKGIPTLINAYQQTLSRGCECSLLLVGDGTDKLHYRKSVAQLGLRNVAFLDFTQPSHLPDIYALGDVFVFPTRADTWGLVVEEAMAAGLPVISSVNAGEIQSRIIEQYNGTLVPVDDMNALADQMEFFATRGNGLVTMGAQAFQSVTWRTLDHWCEQIEKMSNYFEPNHKDAAGL